MRAPFRQSIRVRGKDRSVMVERRAIAPHLAQDGRQEACGYVEASKPFAPAPDRPIAREVTLALLDRPMRFPAMWFRGEG